jgi:hypothetical protein
MGARGKGAGGRGEGNQAQDPLKALYQIPLSEFTPARNALVTRLKKTGRRDEANQVKALIKPSIPAWTVNQLFWQHRLRFDELMAIGERFRTAQAAHFHGQSADVRGPLEERREALSSLARQAAVILRAAGLNATPDAIRRITSTLEALSAMGSSPDGPRAGTLIDDVDPPGFETLASLVPRVDDEDDPAGGPSRVLAFRHHPPAPATAPRKKVPAGRRVEATRAAAVAAARAAVKDAQRAVGAARRAAGKAELALKLVVLQAKDAAEESARAVADAERALADAKGEWVRAKAETT